MPIIIDELRKHTFQTLPVRVAGKAQPTWRAVIHQDTGEVVAMVSNRYKLQQHAEALGPLPSPRDYVLQRVSTQRGGAELTLEFREPTGWTYETGSFYVRRVRTHAVDRRAGTTDRTDTYWLELRGYYALFPVAHKLRDTLQGLRRPMAEATARRLLVEAARAKGRPFVLAGYEGHRRLSGLPPRLAAYAALCFWLDGARGPLPLRERRAKRFLETLLTMKRTRR